MNVVFPGFNRFWFEYLSQLLPPSASARLLENRGKLSEIPPESVVFLDRPEYLASDQLNEMASAKRLLLLHRPGELQPDTSNWPERIKAKTILVCVDNTLAAESQSSLPTLPLSCGAVSDGPFRSHSFVAGDPITVGLLKDSGSQIPAAEWSDRPQLIKQEIEVGQDTALATVISMIEQCDIIVETVRPESYPGIISWLALAQGRAVICDMSIMKNKSLAASERLLPLIDSNAANLMGTIDSLARDPRTLRDLSRRGIDFITSYRRLERSRAQMAKILEI